MNISEVKTFVQENDWRILVSIVGLVLISFLAPSEESDAMDACVNQVAAGSISDISQVRAADVVNCYEETKDSAHEAVLPFSP